MLRYAKFWQRGRLFLIVGTMTLVTTIIYYNFTYNLTTNYYKIVYSDARRNKTIKTVKYILLWNSMFNSENWYLSPKNVTTFGEQYFKYLACETTNCVITSKHEYLHDQIDYDAIIFHSHRDWPHKNSVPTVRSPHQNYIMALKESPDNTPHHFNRDINFFNWTMTYKLDSDILYPYRTIIDSETRQFVAPSESPNWKPYEQNFFDSELLKLAEKKTKLIAWFVSHCDTTSRREHLVKEMRKYMPVDIYGKCGDLKCTDRAKCDAMLDNDYKFYLAFENSLCPDYVTEKLFNTLNRQIIPIVYGGADYAKFAPPKSYINANDFKSVPDLIKYLKYLDENPKEYIKYFWWKKYYTLVAGSNLAFCEICKKLNQPNLPKKVYSNLTSWWGECSKQSYIKFKSK